MRTDREKHGLRGSVESVLVETTRFEDQAGQITEKPWFSHTMTFNHDGWVTQQINRNPDGSEWRTVSDYSDSGKLLATRSYEPSGVLANEVRYVYDVEERLIAEQQIDQDGKVTTRITYAYDTGGGKIKIEELDFSRAVKGMVGLDGTSISSTRVTSP